MANEEIKEAKKVRMHRASVQVPSAACAGTHISAEDGCVRTAKHTLNAVSAWLYRRRSTSAQAIETNEEVEREANAGAAAVDDE